MHKLTFLLLTLLVAVSFADVLFEQPWDGSCTNGYSLVNYAADDFTLTNSSRLESIAWWGFYSSTVDGTFDVALYEDASGLPGTVIFSETGVSPTITNTGDDWSGFDVYLHEFALDSADYLLLDSGSSYWLSLHRVGGTASTYWLCDSGGLSAASNNGTSWVSQSYTMMFQLDGSEDTTAPAVSGQNPADGATDVPANANIVFHITDDYFGVDTSTISFSVEDSSKSTGDTSSLSSRGSTGAITGTLVVDATDPNDVVCTFNPDSNLPPDTITCTIATGLADDAGNATSAAIAWSFDISGSAIEETTWGQLKTM